MDIESRILIESQSKNYETFLYMKSFVDIRPFVSTIQNDHLFPIRTADDFIRQHSRKVGHDVLTGN
jgi:hypothetical protein